MAHGTYPAATAPIPTDTVASGTAAPRAPAPAPAEDAPRPPRPRPSWAMIGLFLIAAMAVFVYAKAVLMPVFFAFLLALTFSPVRRAASKIGVPAGLSAALIVAGLLALVVAGIIGLSAPIRSYVEDGPALLEQAEDKIRMISSTVSTVAEAGEQLEEVAATGDGDAQTVVIDEPGAIAKLAGEAPAVLAQIVLSLALLFFILASGDMFYEKIVHSVPRFKEKRRAVQIIYDVEAKISRYFFTITIINAGLGVCIGLAMWALGMPNPILFGVLAFVFNFVPYVGAVAGVGLAFIVGLLALDTVGQALLAGAIYFSLTSLEGQFVTPYAVGKSLKLNTVAVFLAVALWAWLWSVIGMIVAMPILIALRVFSEHIPTLNGLGDFLSARHSELEKPRAEKPVGV